MPVNAQSSLRSVRADRVPQPAWGLAPDTALSVLYLPSAIRDRATLRDRLARGGATVSVSADLPDALQMLGTRRFSLVVVDLAGERKARATIRLVRAQFPATPIFAVTDATQPLATSEAIEAGVVDVLPWPCGDDDVAAMLATARDTAPADSLPACAELEERLFHQSPSMRPVMDAIKSASDGRAAVLISGESGSGRSLVAKTLHDRGNDYVNGPFIVVDCSESPDDLERRLFGTASDRSGAHGPIAQPERAARGSAVLAAQGGSLFLTHLEAAPAQAQARIARVLREQTLFSADIQETVAVAFRVMASVDPTVDAAIAEGRLHAALIEQLGGIRIDVPPLRRRREDIPLLAGHFLRQACDEDGHTAKRFSRAALTLLAALPWSGNSRELRDVVTATVSQARGAIIQLDDVLEHARIERGAPAPAATNVTLRAARATFERECISATLIRHQGRVSDAARALGIQRTNLYRKVRQLNVPRALLSPQKS